jgi:ABC-type amino acid transport substrate-binding protein
VVSPGVNQLFMRSDVYLGMESNINWNDLTIAVVAGYTFSNEAFDEYLDIARQTGSRKVIFVSGDNVYERLVEMLMRGRVDAIVDDSAFIYHAWHKYRDKLVDTPEFSIVSAGVIGTGENVVGYGLENKERSRELMAIIDPFVEALYQSGDINKFILPYGIKIEAGVITPIN